MKRCTVVVSHGGWDRGLPFALHGALQDTVALAKSLHNCHEEQNKKGVKRGAKAFWGGQTRRTEKLAMAEGRYVKGEHMVMVWCTGTRCERQGKKKSDGQQKRKKGRCVFFLSAASALPFFRRKKWIVRF